MSDDDELTAEVEVVLQGLVETGAIELATMFDRLNSKRDLDIEACSRCSPHASSRSSSSASYALRRR